MKGKDDLINRGMKKMQNLINGGFKINGRGLEFEKGRTILLKGQKEQHQVVMQHKTKLYTEASYFAFKSWLEYYLQRR